MTSLKSTFAFFVRTMSIAVLIFGPLEHSAFSVPGSPLYDARQLRFGFEPTRTNLPIVFESTGAIIKKIITGKGEGVLSAELAVSTKYRQKYIDALKEQCRECRITAARESHGEVTYQIDFPDGYYLRASTDAGALEWQTKPSTITEVRGNTPRLQKNVYDLADEIGVSKRLEAAGGHVTFSGFGNDTFLWGNYLKHRAKNPDLDWGFFGKDGYNATPVQGWAHDQQVKYAAVHVEHDQKWEKFLKELESGLNANVPTDKLIHIYQNRDLMGMEEYSQKLATIYHNPKQENWINTLLGKRSKFKYVANRPGNGLIENRAVVPQRNAAENLKISEFIESEVWYVKDELSKNLDIKFSPTTLVEKQKKGASRSARKIVEDLGLKWKDFVGFSKSGDVDLKGDEKSIARDFTPNEYSAGKRNALFKKLRDRMLSKPSWNTEESVFMGDLLNEMSYTIPEAIENTKFFNERIPAKMMLQSSAKDANALVKNVSSLANKFPVAADEILAPIQEQMHAYVSRSIYDEQVTGARTIVPLLESQRKQGILKSVMKAHQIDPKLGGFGLYADLVLSDPNSANIKAYLLDVTKNHMAGGMTEVPSRFHEIAIEATKMPKLKPYVDGATNEIVQFISNSKNEFKLSGNDPDLLRWLASERPKQAEQILMPLRKHYLQEMEKTKFGLSDYYKTTANFDFLNEITPASEKQQFLDSMMLKVREMDQIKNDPDSKLFIEKIEKEMAKINPAENGAGMSCFGGWLQNVFGSKIRK